MEHAIIQFTFGLNKEIASYITCNRFPTLKGIFQAVLKVERDIKERSSCKYKGYLFTNLWIKNKEVAQPSTEWNKGKDINKYYDKKPMEKTTQKYPPKIEGNKYPNPNPNGF